MKCFYFLVLISCFGLFVNAAEVPDYRSNVQLQLEILKKKNLSDSRKLEVFTILGKNYTELGEYEKALSYLIKSEELDQRIHVPNKSYYAGFAVLFYKIGAYVAANEYEKRILNNDGLLAGYFAAGNLGRNYKLLQNHKEAWKYYSMQMRIARKMNDLLAIASANNNLGLEKYTRGNWESSISYFERAKRLCEKNNLNHTSYFVDQEYDLYYNVLENLGKAYFKVGKFDEALQLLTIAKEKIHQNDLDLNKTTLVEILLKKGQLPEAKKLINTIIVTCDLSSKSKQLLLLDMQIRLALEEGNLPLVKKLSLKRETLAGLNDVELLIEGNRMSKMISNYLIHEAHLVLEKEKKSKSILFKELQIKKRETSLANWSMIGVLILLFAGLLLVFQLYKVRQRSMKLEKDQLSVDNQLKSFTIKSQEAQMMEYALDVSKNKEFEEATIKKLSSILELSENEQSRELGTLVAEMRQKSFIDQRAYDLSKNADELLSIFRFKLTTNHPDLKKPDIHLCQLVRLDLSNKEIAVIKGVATDSIKISKNRLKRKLNLQAEDSLSAYLKDFS